MHAGPGSAERLHQHLPFVALGRREISLLLRLTLEQARRGVCARFFRVFAGAIPDAVLWAAGRMYFAKGMMTDAGANGHERKNRLHTSKYHFAPLDKARGPRIDERVLRFVARRRRARRAPARALLNVKLCDQFQVPLLLLVGSLC